MAVRGEGVQEGVGGGVVALAGGADGAGDGREQHERPDVTGEFVEVEGAERLRREDRVDPLGGERGDDTVVQDAGGVDDRGERVLGREAGEDGGEAVAVGDVTGVGGRGGAEGGEFGDQVVGAARPAEQSEVPYPVGGDQVAGDHRAEASGGAGQQDGALGVEGRLG